MARYASLPIRRKFAGWPGMTPSGLIHALLREVRGNVRVGLRSFLRYLCAFPCDRSSWLGAERAFASASQRRLRWACQWRATRPLLGVLRENSPYDNDMLSRAVVARTRDTIPNASLPRQLQSFGLGVPSIARKMRDYHALHGVDYNVHSSNYELLRQGLSPAEYRTYSFTGNILVLKKRNCTIRVHEDELVHVNPRIHISRIPNKVFRATRPPPLWGVRPEFHPGTTGPEWAHSSSEEDWGINPYSSDGDSDYGESDSD